MAEKIVIVKRIEEPDFGCEGRPDGMPLMDRVLVEEVPDGAEYWLEMEDSLLWQQNVREGDRIVLKEEKN